MVSNRTRVSGNTASDDEVGAAGSCTTSAAALGRQDDVENDAAARPFPAKLRRLRRVWWPLAGNDDAARGAPHNADPASSVSNKDRMRLIRRQLARRKLILFGGVINLSNQSIIKFVVLTAELQLRINCTGMTPQVC